MKVFHKNSHPTPLLTSILHQDPAMRQVEIKVRISILFMLSLPVVVPKKIVDPFPLNSCVHSTPVKFHINTAAQTGQ